MCNIMKLKGKIVENGYNQDTFSKAIGISKSSLIRRLNDGNFTIGEASRIIDKLHLSQSEAVEIFLPKVLQE